MKLRWTPRAFQDLENIFKFIGEENPSTAFSILERIESSIEYLNLKTAVGSRKSAQAIDAPGKSEKALITSKVTTSFSDSPCTPMAYTSFSRPTAVFRLKTYPEIGRKGRIPETRELIISDIPYIGGVPNQNRFH